jgi:Gram-negative bacterial TonB protein C-terminal
MQIRVQRFLVSDEPFYVSCWSSFAALWKSPDPAVSKYSAYMFRKTGGGRAERLGRPFIGSVVLHIVAVFLVLRVADTDLAMRSSTKTTRVKNEVIYYPLPVIHDPKPMPRITPPGPGGRSGRGAQPEVDPKPGSSTFHRDLTVISNPIHPDNNHQTIIQPSTPPDLIIKQDLKLPNVVFGAPLAKPKAPLQFFSNAVKPIETAQTQVQDVAAPQISMADPGLKLASLAPTTPQPRLPVPLALGPGAVPTRSAASAAAAGGVTGDINPGEPNGLLIIGTDPVAGGASISLPPGNKYGAFSISPAGGEPGSPGGVPGGAAGGGTGGLGAGGDESTGLGGEKSGGGGGGRTSEAAPISTNGHGGIDGNHGNVDALLAGGAVFPVISPPHIRRNALVVSAGGVGGGGLGIYQALPCGRIYTIFLPMPTGSWTLQYCHQDDSQGKPNPSANSRVIQLEEGLLPPDPIEKFDFRRVPVPADKAGNKMIVLKGTIREDGFVDNLKVYQGVLKEMDETALAALSKWKFTPARRGGKSVAVQILVGIQISGPVAH